MRLNDRINTRQPAHGKKLPKAERRIQLLEAALAIVRSEGTEALSLGLLAERAGVSKPVTYEHFKSRSGLLVAIYRRIDEEQAKIAFAALEKAPANLHGAARVLSDAYMKCCATVGPEWHSVSAALRGTEEMETFQQELADKYAGMFLEAFLPFANLPRRTLRIYCLGFLGAGESISREMLQRRISKKFASAVFFTLMIGSLDQAAKNPFAEGTG